MAETPSTTRRAIAKRWAVLLALVIAIALAVRLIVVASRLETAPGVLLLLIQDATLGWLGWDHEPINSAPGGRQAEFWVAEADHLLQEDSTSEMARGLAWMLDSPGTGFYARYLKATGIAVMPVDYDSERVAKEITDFEERARDECLNVAESATQLSNDDAHAWRTRALLLFQNPGAEPDERRHVNDWRGVLGEARSHDPDNALYDYLEADELWNESTSYDYSDPNLPFVVTDAERFAEGERLFKQGLQKKLLLASDEDWHAIVRALAHSSVPLHEQPELINNRYHVARETVLEFRLLRMEVERAAKESPAEKLRRLYDCLRLADQIGDSKDLTRIDTARKISDIAAAQISDVLKNHRGDLRVEAFADAERELHVIYARNLVREAAVHDFLASHPRPPQTLSPIFRAMVLSWLFPITVLLAAIALGAWCIARLLSSDADGRRLEIRWHGACWVFGFTGSFVLLGLAPAEVISVANQQMISRVLIFIFPWVAIASILLLWLRRKNWRFSLLELLVATPIVAGLLLASLFGFAKVFETGVGYYVPARLQEGVDAAALQAAVPMFRAGSLEWAMIQWNAYSGVTLAVLLALGCVAVWSWSRGIADESGTQQQRPGRLRATLQALRVSATSVALLALLAFLILAPAFLRECQSRYESQMEWYVDLEGRRDTFAAMVKAIESDHAKMKQLQDRAEQKVRQGG